MLRNKAYFTIITSTVIGTLIIASSMFMVHQRRTINELKEEVYLKRQNEDRASDSYKSVLNEREIRNKFNTLVEYPIMKGCTAEMSHNYNYTQEGRLGFKKHVNLDGHATLKYDICVRLSDCVITSSMDGKTITIQVPKPYVDEESVMIKPNTTVIKGMKATLFANEKDGQQAMKHYNDSFIISGRNRIVKAYSAESKQNYINKVAESEIHSLIRTLNINGDVTIKVKVIE